MSGHSSISNAGASIPIGLNQLQKFWSCCSANNSVGAIIATWKPASIACKAASAHTIVFPDPTSPAKQGYVETLLGRRLLIPGINSSSGIQRKAAERAAINAPLQGTAADIIKLAMIQIDKWIKQ